MTVYVSNLAGVVVVQARGEGPGAVGDLVREVRPGGSAFGIPYDVWAKMPEGANEITVAP